MEELKEIQSISQIRNNLNNVKREDATVFNKSPQILQRIKNAIIDKFPNYNVHISGSYRFIQVWKENWNNSGKRGFHFQIDIRDKEGLSFYQQRGYFNYNKENVKLYFTIHIEDAIDKKIKEEFNKIKGKQNQGIGDEFNFIDEENTNNSVSRVVDIVGKMIKKYEAIIDEIHKKYNLLPN